jgi:hypothetical protein
LHSGRHDEALASARRAVDITGGTSIWAGYLGYVCAMTGHRGEASDILNDIERHGSMGYFSQAALAWIHSALGNPTRAFDCLRAAFEQRDSMMLSLPMFPAWDPIRDTDVFRDIFARMNFPLPGRQALAARRRRDGVDNLRACPVDFKIRPAAASARRYL